MTADTYSSKSCFFSFRRKKVICASDKRTSDVYFYFSYHIKKYDGPKVFFQKLFCWKPSFAPIRFLTEICFFSVGPINTCGWKTGKSEAGKKICYLVMVMRLMLLQCWWCCSADGVAVLMLLQCWCCCSADAVAVQMFLQCWWCCSADDVAVLMMLQCWFCCSADVSLQCHVECCCASWLWSVGHSRRPQDTRAFNLLL